MSNPFVGGMQVEAKLTDARTGQVLGEWVDRQIGGGSPQTAARWQWGGRRERHQRLGEALRDHAGLPDVGNVHAVTTAAEEKGRHAMTKTTFRGLMIGVLLALQSLAGALPVELTDSNGTRYKVNTQVDPLISDSLASGALTNATYTQPTTVTEYYDFCCTLFGGSSMTTPTSTPSALCPAGKT